MQPDIQKYLNFKEKSKDLPTVEVTEEEFIQLMMAEGKTEEEAKMQVTVSRCLGAATMIGGKMVRIG